MLDLDLILKPNEDCPVREIGDGLVIMAPTGDVTHSLEEIGAFIWRQLDGKRSLKEIIDFMTGEYDVSHEQATADLQHFVGELMAADLVNSA